MLQPPDIEAAGVVDMLAPDHRNGERNVLRGFLPAPGGDEDFILTVARPGPGGGRLRIGGGGSLGLGRLGGCRGQNGARRPRQKSGTE